MEHGESLCLTITHTSQNNMKHIYLIRHGQTLANKKWIHQNPDEPLSLLGRKQAEQAALFLKSENIDTLVCSTFTRARETAEILGRGLDLPLTMFDSLVEFRRPNYLYNKSHVTPGSILYIARLFFHRENPVWNDDGAENMFAVRNRVEDAKNLFMELEGERILAVSHAIFMDMFITLACQEKKLTIWEFIGGLLNIKKTPNTGIIHMTYDEKAPPGVCQWQLIEFLDPRS
jgi:broad specificity phosphatase PhoE